MAAALVGCVAAVGPRGFAIRHGPAMLRKTDSLHLEGLQRKLSSEHILA